MKHTILKKSILTTISLCFLFIEFGFAQGNTWKLNGNIAENSDWIGTRNFTDFTIKSNNQTRIRIGKNGTTNFFGNLKLLGDSLNISGVVLADSMKIAHSLKIGDSTLNIVGNSLDPYTTLPNDHIRSTIGRISFGNNLLPNTLFSNISIGIGIQTPKHKLHISHFQPVTNAAPVAVELAFTNNGGNSGGTGILTTDGFLVGISSNGSAIINQQENKPILFYTNNSERMQITADGAVRINSSNSDSKFYVYSNNLGKTGHFYSDYTDVNMGTCVLQSEFFNDQQNLNYLHNICSLIKIAGSTNETVGVRSGINQNGSIYSNHSNYAFLGSINFNAEKNIGLYSFVAGGKTNIAGYFNAPLSPYSKGHAIVTERDGGNVAINVDAINLPTTLQYELYLNGEAFKTNGNGFWVYSDSTLKTNVINYSDGLEQIKKINPVSFEFNGLACTQTDKRYIGVLGQNIAQVAPYMTDTVSVLLDTNFTQTSQVLVYNPDAFTYMIINAVKELDSIVQNDSIYVSNGINKQDHDIKLGGPLTDDTEIGLKKNLLFTSDNSYSGQVCVGSAFTPQNEAFVVNNKTWITSARFLNLKTGPTDNISANFECSGSSNNNYAGQFVAKGNELQSNYGASFLASGKAKVNYGVFSEANDGGMNYAGFFKGELYASSYLNLPSDIRIKTNVQPVTNSLDLIDQLKPKTFYFDTVNFAMLNLPKGKQYGLIAQDVEPFLPNSVKTIVQPAKYDSLGNVIQDSVHFKSLNYEAFIPILIQGIKDLKQTNSTKDSLILSMYERLNALETLVSTCCQNTQAKETIDPSFTKNVELNNTKAIVLNQNMPNPFSENTVITFQIPETVNNAQIMFADNNGSIIKTVEISERGFGELKVYAANLSSGSYVYYLVCDGKTIDTKRMVCTK